MLSWANCPLGSASCFVVQSQSSHLPGGKKSINRQWSVSRKLHLLSYTKDVSDLSWAQDISTSGIHVCFRGPNRRITYIRQQPEGQRSLLQCSCDPCLPTGCWCGRKWKYGGNMRRRESACKCLKRGVTCRCSKHTDSELWSPLRLSAQRAPACTAPPRRANLLPGAEGERTDTEEQMNSVDHGGRKQTTVASSFGQAEINKC